MILLAAYVAHYKKLREKYEQSSFQHLKPITPKTLWEQMIDAALEESTKFVLDFGDVKYEFSAYVRGAEIIPIGSYTATIVGPKRRTAKRRS